MVHGSYGDGRDSNVSHLAFSWTAPLLRRHDQAHIAALLRPVTVIREFNRLAAEVDNAQQKAYDGVHDAYYRLQLKDGKDENLLRWVTQVYGQVRSVMVTARTRLLYICQLTRCSVRPRVLDARFKAFKHPSNETSVIYEKKRQQAGRLDSQRSRQSGLASDDGALLRVKHSADSPPPSSNQSWSSATGDVIAGFAADPDAPGQRRPRQLEFIAAAVSIGLSIYNLAETQALKARVFSLEENQAMLSHVINEQRHATVQLQQEVTEVVDRLRDEVSIANHLQRELHHSEILFVVKNAADAIDSWAADLLDTLLYKKVSPRFFGDDALVQASNRLDARAHARGMSIGYRSLLEILHAPVSYIMDHDVLHLLIHLPVVDARSFSLYKFHQAPLWLSNGRTVRITTNAEYLALDPAMSLVKEFSAQDLAQCARTGRAFICPPQIWEKSTDSSCLASAYAGSRDLLSVCRFEAYHRRLEEVLRVAPDEVIITAPANGSVTALVRCPGQGGQAAKDRAIQVHRQQRIKVPPHCVLTTPHYVLRTALTLHLEETYEVRSVDHLNDALIASLEKEAYERDGERLMPRFVPDSLQAPPTIQTVHWHVSTVVYMVVGLAAVVFTIFLVCSLIKARKVRKEKKIKKAASHAAAIAAAAVEASGSRGRRSRRDFVSQSAVFDGQSASIAE